MNKENTSKCSEPIRGEPSDKPPIVVRIMADYTCYCWDEEGCGTDPSLLFEGVAGITELETAFDSWLDRFETHYPNVAGYVTDLDWASFHRDGRELCRRLKLLLGESAAIYYEKPFEDADKTDAVVLKYEGGEGSEVTPIK